MRKRIVSGVLALIGLSSVAVLGTNLDFVSRAVQSIIEAQLTFTSFDKSPREILQDLGKSKRVEKTAASEKVEVPEPMMWNIVFDFANKMQKRAAEADASGQNSRIYRGYFSRQGPLTPEETQLLNTTAANYAAEIAPLEQQARAINESIRNEDRGNLDKIKPEVDELKRLQGQKDEHALRSKETLRSRLGDDSFVKFDTFVKGDFSKGGPSRATLTASASPEGFDYWPFSWALKDDSEEPFLVTGESELYFFYYYPGYYYDPSLDSFFANVTTSTLLDAGRGDGYRDIFPAYYFHPVYYANYFHTYCTLTDHYGVLYDGPIPVDEIYLESTKDCTTISGPLPTPTPTPTPTPDPTPTPCDPLTTGGLPCMTPTPTPTPTPNVVSVTFSQVNPSTEPITANPQVLPHNPGIGQRIFADDDSVDDTVDHRRVNVSATISPALPGVEVHFRNFDLDDPATDATIDTNNVAGNDNRGTPMPGTLPVTSAMTNASGVATVEFTVTRQPGDNFAIAATTIPAQTTGIAVNGTNLTNAAGGVIPTACTTELVCRSPMLTVWRRLHVEVDTMGVATQNRAVGTIATTTRLRVNETLTIPLNPTSPATLEENRFQGGRLVSAGRSFRVTCNLATPGSVCNTANSVTVTNNNGAVVTLFANTTFTLYDDDDFNDNNGTLLIGDEGENINREPDTGLMTARSDDPNTNAYAAAYIWPLYDVNDPRDDNNFVTNSFGDLPGDTRALFTSGRDLPASANIDNEYWSVYLLGAYQHIVCEDNDPTTDVCPDGSTGFTLGIVDAITTVSPPDFEGSGALIFTELHRPHEYPGYTAAPTNLQSMAVTVAHEVGHLFSCQHGQGGVMGTDPATGAPVSNQLGARMIRNIRGLMHP